MRDVIDAILKIAFSLDMGSDDKALAISAILKAWEVQNELPH